MPWRGGYYYRSERVNGRPRQVYVGGGLVGQIANQLDEAERESRRQQREAARAAREDWAALDQPLDELDALADQLACAALLAAGCRQHKRGEWRKTHGRRAEAGTARGE